MRWKAAFDVPQAAASLPAQTTGQTVTVALEQLPPGGDGPRPNERWILNRIYLPYSVTVSWSGASAPTVANVQLTLTRAGITEWAYSATNPLLTVAIGGASIVAANAIATDDFTNPIYMYCGGSPLLLSMSVSFDQPTNAIVSEVQVSGQSSSTGGTTLTFPPQIGSITYDAISLDDDQFNQTF